MVSDVLLTPEEMIAKAAKAVETNTAGKNQNLSKVQQLLAGREFEDTVELSPVQKILQAQKAEAESQESYFESDDFIRLKVDQLRSQLALYSTLPGLDPSGGAIAGIEAEIQSILEQQQEKLAESTSKADEAQAKLEEQRIAEAREAELFSAEELLARLNGETETEGLSDAAQALLDKVKGSVVDTSA